MAFIVEDGQGLSNSNQYTDRVDVLGYAMSHYGYEWFYREDDCVFKRDEINKAIVSASKKIDSLKWEGYRANKMQAMQFPRKFLYDYCDCCCVPCDVIPSEIKEATIILTLGILKGDINPHSNKTATKVKRMSFDKQSVEFAGGGAYIKSSSDGGCGGGIETVSSDPFNSVRHLLRCYSNKNKANAKFVRSY